MNFLSLQYFLSVAQHRSFKVAAEHLFMTQQSLSEHIRRLEEEVGLMLFERTRPLRLTPAGERMVEGAQEILDAKQRLDLQLHAFKSSENQSLVIGVSSIGRPPFLGALLAAFLLRYPSCVVRVVENTEKLSERDWKAVGLHFMPLSHKRAMQRVKLRKDELVMAVREPCLQRALGADWEKAARLVEQTGRLMPFAALPFILLEGKDSDAPYRLYREHGFEPRVAAQSTSDELNFTLCLEGVGALVMPGGIMKRYVERFGRGCEDFRQFVVKLENHDPSLGIYYDSDHKLSEMEEAFIRVAKDFFGTDNESSLPENETGGRLH